MLKQKYFLTGIFILSAERQPIKLAWRKIVWLLIFPYQFGIETMVDEEGDEITEPRGHIYYKLHEIIEAVEEGNILKCLQKRRTMKYNSK